MNDKTNIINYIEEGGDENFQIFIRGHLYIEALLGEIIQRSYKEPEALSELASMFYRKVKLVRAIGRISHELEDLLLSINSLRNKLAHKLECSLDFESVFILVSKAHNACVDFSDDGIYMDKERSKQDYGINGVVSELMCNTFSHLVWENEDLFSKDDISRLLC